MAGFVGVPGLIPCACSAARACRHAALAMRGGVSAAAPRAAALQRRLPCRTSACRTKRAHRMATRLMEEGARHDRMFTMWLGPKRLLVATHPDTARSVLTRPADFIKSGGEQKPHALIVDQ
eukprot:gene46056-43027_t